MGDMASGFDRRRFTAFLTAFGLAGTALPRLLWAEVEDEGSVSLEALKGAEQLAGLEFTDDERELMLEGLDDLRQDYEKLREIPIDNSVPPALHFQPVLPGMSLPNWPVVPRNSRPRLTGRPDSDSELAFLPVSELGNLVRTRAVTSEELTVLYLDRLKTFDPQLHCVITLTEERAMEQARRADRELADGMWRGPLHGIPWGAKDLLAVRGYPTTWGAKPFEDQVIDEDATVVRKLDDAGAVLVAKLTLGALAWGDVWYGEKTRNPWNTEQGSSGSSAGPGSATAAGLVGFSIGSETWGSIVSPSTRCGVTGLRPTFGRVSRHGAMALSWSMDKLGPMCRSVEDCALVFGAIQGADGLDLSAVERPFVWDAEFDVKELRVGFLASAFDRELEFGDNDSEEDRARAREWKAADLETLEVLRSLGIELVPIESARPAGQRSFVHPVRRSRRGLRRPHPFRPGRPSGAPDRGCMAQRLPPGTNHTGGRVHPGRPGADPVDAGDETDPRRRGLLDGPVLRRRQPAPHQPHGSPGGSGAERLRHRRHADKRDLQRAPLR